MSLRQALLAVLTAVPPAGAATAAPPVAPITIPVKGATEVVPGEVVVKLRHAADVDALVSGGAMALAHRPELAEVLERFGASRGRRVFPNVRSRRLDQVLLLKAAGDAASAPALIAELRRRPEVEYAHPNFILKTSWVPNDPYYSSSGAWQQPFRDLWGLQKLGVESAWDRSRGAGVVVAVLDTGIDETHADLAGQVWRNPGEMGIVPQTGADRRTNGIDDDGNGYIDDWRGWDFASSDNAPDDGHGHGTHVSGTIAAAADNGAGIAGVAPLAKIMALKVLNDQGAGGIAGIAAGIVYAADNGARVLNLSLGGAMTGPTVLSDAVSHAHDVRDAVVVAAAGNSTTDIGTPGFGIAPASLRDVMAVSAFDGADRPASFSNYGLKVDLAAPGGGDAAPAGGYEPARSILSLKAVNARTEMTGNGQLVVGERYLRQAGTSMAAPHVAGVAALVRALRPSLSAEQVRQAMRRGADDVGIAGFDRESGYGRVNANRALDDPSPLAVQITGPLEPFSASAAPVVTGTAAGPGFLDWTLELGVGNYPVSWTLLAASASPVTDGVFTMLGAASIADGYYTLRLSARSVTGRTYEDRAVLVVDSVAITSPLTESRPTYRSGETVAVTGSAAPAAFQSFFLRITGALHGELASPNVTLAGGGTAPVVNGPLAFWDTAGVPADHYRVCVVVLHGSTWAQECTNVIVDPTLHAGWPKDLGLVRNGGYIVGLFDHLTAADLDGDGDKELLVAYDRHVRVYEHTGAMAPGWPQGIDPYNWGPGIQFGPAVGDLTGDGRPEVVALNTWGYVFVWSSGGQLLPGWPRPLIPLWGSLQVDDLDGDGLAEIVISTHVGTVFVFDHNGVPWPGWPQGGGQSVCLGDVDGDGVREIVSATAQDVIVRRLDGTPLPGWPRTLTSAAPVLLYVKPAIGDLDGDGKREIVVGNIEGKVFAFRHDGSDLPGWPQQARGTAVNSPVVGDIDGDGRPEVVVGSWWEQSGSTLENWLFAWRADGTLLPNWPVRYDRPVTSIYYGYGTPVLADVDGDARADVVVSSDGEWETPLVVNAYKASGERVAGFPKPVWQLGPMASSPVVADLDGDGSNELAWIDLFLKAYVWDLPSPATAPAPWPMFHHDAGHTGRLGPDPVRLKLSVVGYQGATGAVVVTPPGAACDNFAGPPQTCTINYPQASTVTLQPAPGTRSSFTGWSGACSSAGSGPCTIRLGGIREVTARFDFVNQAPFSNPGGPYTAFRNQLVTLDGSQSSDFDGDPIVYYLWSFGDGTSGEGVAPTHAYSTPGAFTVTLVVNDGRAWSAHTMTTVTVTNRPPVVKDMGPVSGTNAAAVTFTAHGFDPDGDALTYSWTFGDGGDASGAQVSHQYSTGGTYKAQVRVSDGYAQSAESVQVVIADVIPPAAVTTLVATTPGLDFVGLAWKATGDNGQKGTAASYDVRYSTAPITPIRFDTATPADGEPEPAPAGTPHSFTVTGLAPGTLYYFAMVVSDGAGNVSPISNVVSMTTGVEDGGIVVEPPVEPGPDIDPEREPVVSSVR